MIDQVSVFLIEKNQMTITLMKMTILLNHVMQDALDVIKLEHLLIKIVWLVNQVIILMNLKINA